MENKTSSDSFYSCDISPNKLKENKDYLKDFIKGLLIIEKYISDNEYFCKDMENNLNNLEEKYKQKLPFTPKERADEIRNAYKINNIVVQKVYNYYKDTYKKEMEDYYNEIEELKKTCQDPNCNLCKHENDLIDISNFQYDIQLFFRDWSIDGLKDRQNIIEVIKELDKYFNQDQIDKGLNILVPGCGLGRLTYELMKKGYFVEACEYNPTTILLFDYFIRTLPEKNSLPVIPLIDYVVNCYDMDSILHEYKFPDVDFKEDLKNCKGKLNLSYGDFNQLYQDQKGKYDCIITLFFIDTSPNIIEYIENISEYLKVGGVWINLGPLLYHFECIENKNSIELTYEEVKQVIKEYGFEIKNDEVKHCYYNFVENNMFKKDYDCPLMSAIKIK